MTKDVNVRISINMSLESYNYLLQASKLQKRQTIIEEAMNLHRNNSLNKEKIAYLESEIKYIKLDLENKKELIFSLNNNLESEPIRMKLLEHFLENIVEKLDMIVKTIHD
jgi:hypothetical protein